MMEYLASGKIIITTYTEEFDLKEHSSKIKMSRENKEYNSLLNYDISKYKQVLVQIPTYTDRILEISKLITNQT